MPRGKQAVGAAKGLYDAAAEARKSLYAVTKVVCIKMSRLEKGPQYNVSVASHLAGRSSGYDPSRRPLIYYIPQTGRRVGVPSEVLG